ncbi:MAG: acyltransferase family protein [Coriobacteriales bacterium]|jgi:peptidoglycan/LPS O-acetylase OafA/YrhL
MRLAIRNTVTADGRKGTSFNKRGFEMTTHVRGRYIPALDGLRAFAVLAVIFYHMGFTWAQGGLLGVTMFFVLSGFLITGLLLMELRTTHTINLPQFWLRRVRRLVPAIVLVILVVAVLCTIFNHVLLTKMRPDVVPSLFFFSNWWQIFHNVSYFEAMGSPSPLQHFWSLAIEEQYYLIWPPLLLLLVKSRVKKTTVRRGLLVAALVSVLLMAFIYNPDADPSRVYYGTDTRAFSLLIGAWLAFIWPMGQLTEKQAEKVAGKPKWVLEICGTIALIGVLAMCAFANGYSPLLYRGGILLCSALTALTIAAIAHPASLLGRVVGCKPLVWIGKRSYGMYLWHYPILLLMTNPNATDGPNYLWCILELAIIFVVSALSYKFIENPLRHGALGKWVRAVRDGSINVWAFVRGHVIQVVAGVALVLAAVLGLALTPPAQGVQGMDQMQQQSEEQQAMLEKLRGLEKSDKVYDVLLIGDSISVRPTPYFQETFPNGLIDAAINRQMSEAQEIFETYDKQGAVGDTVVFAVGTNGPITTELINSLIDAVGSSRQIYFVNLRAPDDFIDANNEVIQQAVDSHDNVHLIDWHSLSAGHEEYFDGDGTHLTEEASAIYIEMIREALGYQTPTDAEGVGDTAHDIYGIAAGDAENVLDNGIEEPKEPLLSRIAGALRSDNTEEQPADAA